MAKIPLKILVVVFVSALILPGCASRTPSEKLDRFIREEVKDPDRSAALQSLADRLDAELGAFSSDIHTYTGRILEMTGNHDVTSDQIGEVMSEFDIVRKKHQDNLFTLFTEMRSQCTEEEWAHLSKIHIEMLSQALAETQPAS